MYLPLLINIPMEPLTYWQHIDKVNHSACGSVASELIKEVMVELDKPAIPGQLLDMCNYFLQLGDDGYRLLWL